MSQLMTIDEIYRQFNSEWVLVEDPELDEQLNVLKGKVVCHSKDRDEVYQKAVELKPKQSAFLYTGRMPANTAIIL